jgi:hypothetical protein
MVVGISYYLFILSINRGFSMNKRLLQIILEELNTTFRDSLGTIEKRLIESGMSANQATITSTKMILQELSKSELQALFKEPGNLEKFIDKSTNDNDTFEKTKKELGDLVAKEPMLAKAVSNVMQGLKASRDDKLAKATQQPTAKGKSTTKTSAPKAPKAAPKQKAAPKPKTAPAPTPPDPDLQYLNQLQNMKSGDLGKLGRTLGKNKAERDRAFAALRKAPEATAKTIARKLGLNPSDIIAAAPKPIAKPAIDKKPAATATSAKSGAGKPKKKVKKLTPGQKARGVIKKYKDFVDGGDDKQISKKFTVSKADKEKLPKFGKVGKQVKGGTKKQAADRDTAASPHSSGDAFAQGNKGDSVSCLRGRVMDDGDYQQRETTAATILGGGVDKEQTPLPFGRGRWTKERKEQFSAVSRQQADVKAIKSVINFMGAAARYGYDPVKYWPNFLWATATDITLKGKPRSPVCLDPRNKADVDKHLALQKQDGADGKNKIKDKRKKYPMKQKNEAIEQFIHNAIVEETNFDLKLPRLPEDFCYNGCSEQYLAEASKRNVKLIPKYKNYVAGLRQKSKGMNLDQFLDLIKYKE